MATDKFCSVEVEAGDKFCSVTVADGDKFCSVTVGISAGSITASDLLFFFAPDSDTSNITATGSWNSYIIEDALDMIDTFDSSGTSVQDMDVDIFDPGQYAEAEIRVRLDSDSGIYDPCYITYDDGS